MPVLGEHLPQKYLFSYKNGGRLGQVLLLWNADRERRRPFRGRCLAPTDAITLF